MKCGVGVLACSITAGGGGSTFFCAALKAVGVNLFRATAVRRARNRAGETGQGDNSRYSRFIARVKEQIAAMGNAINHFFVPAPFSISVELKLSP